MPTAKNIKTEVVTITPAVAKKFLKKNTNMRKPGMPWVKDLAREMKAGQWELNGEAIKFNSRGNLIDGQHRLMAVVESGVTIQSLVIYGGFSDLRLDMGKRRKFGDVLRGEGQVNVNEKAAAVRLIWLYENDCFGRNIYASNYELLKVWKRHAKDFNKYHDKLRMKKSVGLPFSQVFGFYLIFKPISKQNADCFLEAMQLKGDFDLGADDPMLWVRNRFISERIENRDGSKLSTIHRQAIVIKAWNMWWDDVPVNVRGGVQWVRTGPTREKFPIIRGGKWDKHK